MIRSRTMSSRQLLLVVVAGALSVTALPPVTAGADSAPAAMATATHRYVLRIPRPAKFDQFGSEVVASGNTVAITAPDRKVGRHIEAGAIYVFTRPASGWSNEANPAILTFPAATNTDPITVAITATTIVIGESNATVNAHSDQGAVYVYSKPRAGWKSTSHPTATLTAKKGLANDSLGAAVAIAGNTVFAGAPGHEGGAKAGDGLVYIYNKPARGWKSTSAAVTLSNPTTNRFDDFGLGLAVSGTTLIIGAPSHNIGTAVYAGIAYVYLEPRAGWGHATLARTLESHAPMTNDLFANQGAIAVAGRTVAIGAPAYAPNIAGTGPGVGEVFVEPAAGWKIRKPLLHPLTQTATLTASGAPNGSAVGYSVAMSGGTIALGAPVQTEHSKPFVGAAYLFTEPRRGWKSRTQTTTIASPTHQGNESFGLLALTGPTLIVGSPFAAVGAGAAFVYAASAPKLSRVAQSHSSWTLGTKPLRLNPKRRPSGGTEFSFTVNEAASVTVKLTWSKHRRQHVAGSFTVNTKAGKNTVFFDGIIDHQQALFATRYTASISATNASGTSAPQTLRFTTHVAKTRRT
jgi:hypothetical protein